MLTRRLGFNLVRRDIYDLPHKPMDEGEVKHLGLVSTVPFTYFLVAKAVARRVKKIDADAQTKFLPGELPRDEPQDLAVERGVVARLPFNVVGAH